MRNIRRVSVALASVALSAGLLAVSAPANAMDTTWCPACAHASTHK